MKTKLVLTFILLTNVIIAQWTRINNSPSQATQIYFYNPSLGYSLKQDKIYKTTNGGTSWNNAPTGLTSFDNVNGISFVSPDSGFISIKNSMTFSYPVTIYMTLNGGTSWSPLLGPFNNCELSYHLASKNDWYFYLSTYGLGLDTIYHTTNGGGSWTKTANATTPQYNQMINNLIVYKDSSGTGNKRFFCKSTNGGATWNVLLTDSTISSAFMDYQFFNNTLGYALLYQFNNNDTIPSRLYKTTNGGLNWTHDNLPVACMGPQSIHFTDGNNGYIISNNTTQSSVFKTSDGGQTWNQDFTALTNEYFSSYGVADYFGTLYLLGNTIISNKIVTTSLNEFTKEKPHFNLYPNPAMDELSITTLTQQENRSFTIIDVTGRELYSFTMEQSLSKKINVGFLSSGVYLVKSRETSKAILFVKE